MTIRKFLFVDSNGDATESTGAFEQADHINTSTGAADAGKPIILDANGEIDASMINFGAIDHGSLSGLADDDHTQYIRVDGTRPFTGDQSMGGFKLSSLAAPTVGGDATNKSYVDAVAVGLAPKGNVEAATTVNITLSGLQAIDTYMTIAGDRILVKDQTDLTENGIYIAAAGAWVRSDDQDNDPLAEIVNGVFVPMVIGGSLNQDKPFFISSVGTGTNGMHTIGVDDIIWELFTSPTQLTSGDGIDIVANVVSVDIKASAGLKFDSTELAVEPADFAGLGLVDDGADNLAIDFSTAFNDQKAIAAEDLNSSVNGEGASIVGIEDSLGNFVATDVEGALGELYDLAKVSTGETALAGAGGVTVGDMLYYSAADTVSTMPINVSHRCVGIALASVAAGVEVKYARWDELVEGVLVGATAGQRYYWDGSALVNSIPSGSGQYVWAAGIAKNSTDMLAIVEYIKKNS